MIGWPPSAACPDACLPGELVAAAHVPAGEADAQVKPLAAVARQSSQPSTASGSSVTVTWSRCVHVAMGRHDNPAVDSASADLGAGPDGRCRCWWCLGADDYLAYHDEEWGRPSRDEAHLFELLTLEAFQSGLSWLTILRKREGFRAAFEGWDVERVAAYGDREVERLLGDPGIVRHRGKVEATLANARAVVALHNERLRSPRCSGASRPSRARPPHHAPSSLPSTPGVGRARRRSCAGAASASSARPWPTR